MADAFVVVVVGCEEPSQWGVDPHTVSPPAVTVGAAIANAARIACSLGNVAPFATGLAVLLGTPIPTSSSSSSSSSSSPAGWSTQVPLPQDASVMDALTHRAPSHGPTAASSSTEASSLTTVLQAVLARAQAQAHAQPSAGAAGAAGAGVGAAVSLAVLALVLDPSAQALGPACADLYTAIYAGVLASQAPDASISLCIAAAGAGSAGDSSRAALPPRELMDARIVSLPRDPDAWADQLLDTVRDSFGLVGVDLFVGEDPARDRDVLLCHSGLAVAGLEGLWVKSWVPGVDIGAFTAKAVVEAAPLHPAGSVWQSLLLDKVAAGKVADGLWAVMLVASGAAQSARELSMQAPTHVLMLRPHSAQASLYVLCPLTSLDTDAPPIDALAVSLPCAGARTAAYAAAAASGSLACATRVFPVVDSETVLFSTRLSDVAHDMVAPLVDAVSQGALAADPALLPTCKDVVSTFVQAWEGHAFALFPHERSFQTVSTLYSALWLELLDLVVAHGTDQPPGSPLRQLAGFMRDAVAKSDKIKLAADARAPPSASASGSAAGSAQPNPAAPAYNKDVPSRRYTTIELHDMGYLAQEQEARAARKRRSSGAPGGGSASAAAEQAREPKRAKGLLDVLL